MYWIDAGYREYMRRHFWLYGSVCRYILTAHLRTMADRGTARVGRSKAKTNGPRKTKKVTKSLGKAAARSMLKNDEAVEDYLYALREGRLPDRYHLGSVTRALGGGRFEVALRGSAVVQASLSGTLEGRGKFFHNPEATTAVHVGSYVVVEDLGLGHMAGGTSHQIVGKMDAAQAAEARELLAAAGGGGAGAAAGGRSSSSLFNRSSEKRMVEAARKERMTEAQAIMRGTRFRVSFSASGSPASSSSSSNKHVNWAAVAATKKDEKKERRRETRRAKRAAAATGGGGTAPGGSSSKSSSK